MLSEDTLLSLLTHLLMHSQCNIWLIIFREFDKKQGRDLLGLVRQQWLTHCVHMLKLREAFAYAE